MSNIVYTFTSVQTLSDFFRRRAEDATSRAARTTGKLKTRLEAEAATFHEVASMLACTIFLQPPSSPSSPSTPL